MTVRTVYCEDYYLDSEAGHLCRSAVSLMYDAGGSLTNDPTAVVKTELSGMPCRLSLVVLLCVMCGVVDCRCCMGGWGSYVWCGLWVVGLAEMCCDGRCDVDERSVAVGLGSVLAWLTVGGDRLVAWVGFGVFGVWFRWGSFGSLSVECC